MDVNVSERKVHKVHIQDKKVEEQRADRCSLQRLENDAFSGVHLLPNLILCMTLYVQCHRTTTTTMPNKRQQTKGKLKVVMLKLLLKRKTKK
jgi:hypothetical protein